MLVKNAFSWWCHHIWFLHELIDYEVPSCRNTDGPESVKAEWQNFPSWGSGTIPSNPVRTKENLQDIQDWPFWAVCEGKKQQIKVM